MERKFKRPVTKWEIIVAIIVVIMGLIGGFIGYSYPDHPVIGKNRSVFIFITATYFILKIIEKYLGIGKKS